MAQQTINVGAAPNDGTGTPLRTAFQYTNSNFSELYTAVGPSGNNIVVPGTATITGDLTVDTSTLKVDSANNRVGINTTTPNQNLEITGSGNPLVADGCSAVRLNNTVSGRPAVVGVDDSQNFVIWNVGTEVSETIKFLTGGGNGKEQYRITHGGLFNWYDGAGGTRMTLNATGLGVGDSPFAGTRLTLRESATNPNALAMTNRNATQTWRLSVDVNAVDDKILGFYDSTSTTFRMQLTDTGNLGVGVTPSASGGCLQLKSGITFPATQVASSDANTLDDYEEGTWTPVVADASTGGNTGTCTINSAKYVKIGRQVSVQCDISGITTTGMTAGNVFYIRGLPFTSVQGGNGNFYTYRVGRNASTVSSSAVAPDATSHIVFSLFTTNSATTDIALLVSDIVSTTSQIILSVTYFV